jgi:hypothetical protein
MTIADWINVAKCANRRKITTEGPWVAFHIPGSETWQGDHASERCAIRMAQLLASN